VNGLLGIDVEKEGALVLAPVGLTGPSAGITPLITLLDHAVVPLSSGEVDYPVLRDAYYNSSFDSEAEVQDWRDSSPGQPPTTPAPALARVALPAPTPRAGRSLAATVMRRGSTRQFSGEPISGVEFSTALYHATRGWPADVPAGLVEMFVNVHAVEGVEPGAYHYDRAGHGLELIRRGDFRRESGFLCLGQLLGGASSATVFFLADLGAILPRWGNRGYRVANLEAGLIGGRLYLAAYAQGFGATGLTFYDRAVVEFFSPASAGLDALFVTALGRSASTQGSAAPAQAGLLRPRVIC
jgi:SagB-type dehydrogenase family enzyme